MSAEDIDEKLHNLRFEDIERLVLASCYLLDASMFFYGHLKVSEAEGMTQAWRKVIEEVQAALVPCGFERDSTEQVRANLERLGLPEKWKGLMG